MNPVGSSALSDLGLAVKQSPVRKQLGQDEFLKLMTTQMKFQDPFKPMESGEFLGQIAQFSTVSGIQSMQDSLTAFTSSMQSNQTLQAAQLVGHGVLVAADQVYLQDGNDVEAAADLSASGQAIAEITDASGQVVRHIDLGMRPAGMASFTWDGRDDAGRALPEGHYGLQARLVSGNSTQALPTLAVGLVNSISLSGSGLSLNLAGMPAASLGDVRQIL